MPKTVLIPDASSAIGEAAGALFARRGWNVVTSLAGRVDAFVNIPRGTLCGVFESTPAVTIREHFDANVFGVMDVVRALLPQFRAHEGGRIVHVSSAAGVVTLPLMASACAANFALEGFFESLAHELAARDIVVKIVVQGFPDPVAETSALADYSAFVESTNAAFVRMRPARSKSAEEVAQVIFDAATDTTDRLRYPIGDDPRGFLRARREMSDQDYVDFMRSHFRD